MRIWLGLGLLTFGAVIAAQGKTDQPSLGAVAKATKEEKAAKTGRAGKAGGTEQETVKYTNEDLVGRPRASYRHRSVGTALPLATDGRGADEYFWRSRAARIRERLQSATDRLNLLKTQLESVKADGLDVSLANGRYSPMQAERQRLKVQVVDAEAQVHHYEQQMKDLEEEGRRAGALPGWFR